MTLNQFINQNKVEIDESIHNINSDCKINNEERKLWVLNHEALFLWAYSEGVREGLV